MPYNQVTADTSDKSLQCAVDKAATWSSDNDMRLNALKTKELFICFAKYPPDVDSIVVEGTINIVDRVKDCTLLVVWGK